MGDRCYSTVVCGKRDKYVFEKMGYRLEESQALSADGNEIPGAVVMVDEQANYGHYDELTALIGIPFLVCGGSCPGAYGDHLIVSDGKEWHHSEALHESNYPAVRVEYGGVIRDSEVDDARKYWMVYTTAVAAIKRAALHGASPKLNEASSTEQNSHRGSTK
jgi:hypothetical protein